jgi:hypothetical protein
LVQVIGVPTVPFPERVPPPVDTAVKYPRPVHGVPVTNWEVVVEMITPLGLTARNELARLLPKVICETVLEARMFVPFAVKLCVPRFTAAVAPV